MQPFDGDIKTLYNLIILKRIYNFVGAVNFVLLFFIILGIMTFFLGLSGIELWSWLSILRSLSYVVQAIFLILSSAEVFHVLLGVTRYFNTKDKRKRTAAVGLIIRVGRPSRAELYGKKRERGPNSYDFAPETLDALLRRYKATDYCVQLLRAIRLAWNVAESPGILHAINRGSNAGEDIACNTATAAASRIRS